MTFSSTPIRLSLIAALGACSFGAVAQPIDPAAPQPQVDAQVQAQAQAEIQPQTQSESQPAAPMDERADRRCLRATGSRVTADSNASSDTRQERADEAAGKQPDCAIGSGDVYTRKDLDRTGHTNIEDALKALDPRVD